jgi:hypothetical protein
MFAAAEPLKAFLKACGYKFRITWRGRSTGGNVCVLEVEFDDAEAGDDALCIRSRSAAFANNLRPMAYTSVPNIAPTALVTLIAKAPQKRTRIKPMVMLAPPVRADSAPRTARKTREAATTEEIKPALGAKAAVNRGMAAPMVKLAADARAACSGPAFRVSVIPSSSRA